MVVLKQSLSAWGTPAFAGVFKAEVEALEAQALPLQQGLSRSDFALGEGFEVMLLNARASVSGIRVKAGIFSRGVIAGCSCADDPTPPNETCEYCELLFDIVAPGGHTSISLV